MHIRINSYQIGAVRLIRLITVNSAEIGVGRTISFIRVKQRSNTLIRVKARNRPY